MLLVGCHGSIKEYKLEDGTILKIGTYDAQAVEPMLDPDNDILYQSDTTAGSSSESISYEIITKEQKDEILEKASFNGNENKYEGFKQEEDATYYYLLQPFREEQNYEMTGNERYWFYIYTPVDDVKRFNHVWLTDGVPSSHFSCSIETWIDQ